MARFFIDRPIFAWVISIVIMLAGALAILKLPVAQYPTIALPSVSINASYTGASAETLDTTVTQVIEQQMNGIDNLVYMASNSDSAGVATITLTFAAGTNADIAQVQVQNKLQQITSKLPQDVQRQGLQVTKSTSSFLMVVGFVDMDNNMTQTDLGDYVDSFIKDPLSRVSGVGETTLFGAPYSMRIWIKPGELNNYKLNIADIKAAIVAYNAQVSAGQLGGTPAVEGQQLTATITAQSRLQTPEQFGSILLRTNVDGSTVHLRDIAKIELGQQSYDVIPRYNRFPATGLGIKLASNANALDTANAVRAKIEELQPFFPKGMTATYPYDTTPFIKASINSVFQTLIEAIILVCLIMYLFLQNFRATLIPSIAVPVVLLGTFGILAIAGYSINMLTMFGVVLAIGLLVDDAIVVVENVERLMSEEGLSPRDATIKSMQQITGALVGIALVLSAVFVPMAFFGGSTGVIYRQFSITIVSAMALSVLVALTLTPALCAKILKPVAKGHQQHSKGFFGWFNRTFEKNQKRYSNGVSRVLSHRLLFLAFYAVIVVGMGVLFRVIPSAFLPDEDQGIMLIQGQLPPGATQERSMEVVKQIEDYFLNNEMDTIRSTFVIQGFSFAGRGQNTIMGFIALKDWSERPDKKKQSVKALAGRASAYFSTIRDASVYAFAPPAIIEMGNAMGFDVQIQDKGALGHAALMQARGMFLGKAYSPEFQGRLMGVRPNGLDDMPQYKLEVDQAKSGALGVSLQAINETLQSAWGGAYVDDFIDKGRVKKVFLQADNDSRMLPEDLSKWYVRNNVGEMVPFSAFATGNWVYGSPRLERYNSMPSTEFVGEPAPGQSTGEAMIAVEKIMADIAQVLPGIGFEWTGISLQERQSGSQAPALYAISMLVVFLCLAALYESWSIPFSVMMIVPLGIIGAQLAAYAFGLKDDVYFQVGFLTIIGLSAKNAILIVEFARTLQDEGLSLVTATLEACRVRLRPILMTSLAFILGVVPLARSTGAGSGSQNAIGIGVIGGMLSATILGIFFIPLSFVLVRRIFSRKATREADRELRRKELEQAIAEGGD